MICGYIGAEENNEKIDIIKNGGFESVLNGQPSYWETFSMDEENWMFTLDNTIKHNGNASASISGNGEWAYWMQSFKGETIPRGSNVTVSGHIKTEDVEKSAEIEIWYADSDGTPTKVTTAPIIGTKDWTFVTVSCHIPEDAIRTDICLCLMIRGSGKVWFDDIQLSVKL